MEFLSTPYYVCLVFAVITTLIIMFHLYYLDTNERVKLPLVGYFGLVLTIPIPYFNLIPIIILIGYMGKGTYIAIKCKYFEKFIASITEDY